MLLPAQLLFRKKKKFWIEAHSTENLPQFCLESIFFQYHHILFLVPLFLKHGISAYPYWKPLCSFTWWTPGEFLNLQDFGFPSFPKSYVGKTKSNSKTRGWVLSTDNAASGLSAAKATAMCMSCRWPRCSTDREQSHLHRKSDHLVSRNELQALLVGFEEHSARLFPSQYLNKHF